MSSTGALPISKMTWWLFNSGLQIKLVKRHLNHRRLWGDRCVCTAPGFDLKVSQFRKPLSRLYSVQQCAGNKVCTKSPSNFRSNQQEKSVCCNLLPICGTMVAIWVTFGKQTHGILRRWRFANNSRNGSVLKSSQSQCFVEVVVLPILYTEISCSDSPKPF